ncbi:class I SAM-dependent DNA methyltransferase [Helicobacter sp. MIT 03-1614]|uniref:Eco57I restriction-modification methylase domain-containing protein n=2 Tax=unclassified Helicobacter TaxID=2593540 RepID=UPI00068B94A2|nr:Eco57I restriction-modification methylase domain-containing protein [Helicobacter sp. MIT 03-1614]TLD90486.1 class I SAM-dependent DNA methyltransferase [Helicobacter sp. MIT 03-1614]
MLGKVFENLIDYNKSSGAFYTPREIVHFMCKNVLTRTLQERILHDESHLTQDTESPHAHKDSLYNFIFYKQSDDFIAQNAKQLTQAITSLKILDPAIGSGAFPMGMLSEILEALHTLNPSLQKQDLARYKREIIEQQIYGIDIDADAIEIAKLRFWLSIAVDEDTPSPLPNLDFKFMQGNALIESINGIEIIPSDLNAPQHQKDLWGKTSNANASLFDKSQTHKLEALFLQYYEPNAQKAQLKAEILAIMKEAFDERIKQIDENIQSIKANPKSKPKERDKQQEKILQYESFKHDLNTLFKDYKEHNFHTDKLFLYRFFFAPIFAQGGFDIVIGNPPYIKEADNKKLFDGTRHLRTYQGKMDIWYHFVGLGFDIVKNKDIVTFIATNNWTTNTGAKNLRNVILTESQILNLIDFGSYMCFNAASIQTMVMEFQKRDSIPESYQINYAKIESKKPTDSHREAILKRESFEDNIYLEPSITPSQMLNKSLTFTDSKQEEVLNKILENGTFYLRDDEAQIGIGLTDKVKKKMGLTNYEVGAGIFQISTKELKSLHLTKSELKLIKPLYTSNELFRFYGNPNNDEWVIYTDSSFKNPNSMDKYPNLKKHLDNFRDVITSDNKPYGLHRAKQEYFFNKTPSIVSLRKCPDKPIFTYVDFDCYVTSTFFIIQTSRIDLKFLTGLLNSKLIAFWLRHKGKMQGNNYQIDKEPLMNIPIPKINAKNQTIVNQIIALVDEILDIKNKDSNANILHLESEIDRLVYALYKLDSKEIKIIESI